MTDAERGLALAKFIDQAIVLCQRFQAGSCDTDENHDAFHAEKIADGLTQLTKTGEEVFPDRLVVAEPYIESP